MRRPFAPQTKTETPAPPPPATQRKQAEESPQVEQPADAAAPHSFAGLPVLASPAPDAAERPGGKPVKPLAPRAAEKKTVGIGDHPPEDVFDLAAGPAPEEEHVLFPQNSATPAAGAAKKIADLLGKQTGPVTVIIDGYASEEGGEEYNRNLSAHRAAALKHALEGLLPANSQIVLHAHGEGKEWGPPEQNRRAGVHIVPGATAASGASTFHVDLHLVPRLELGKKEGNSLAYGIKPDLDIVPKLPPSYFLSDPAPAPNVFQLPKLQTPQPNWGDLSAPFAGHGIRLTDRDIGALEQNFTLGYNFFLSLGFNPKDAADYASKATGAAYDIQLSKENPTAMDRMNAESEKFGGPGKPTTIPILTPGVIEWVWPKIKRAF